MRAQEIIRAKREGRALDDAQIEAFVRGVATRSWSEGQVAALAMAICLRGMTRDETVALTRAMTASGQVLDWSRERFGRPVLDKHSTGGVGDKVSLLLAPIVAACGAVVPMVSGRGLGHTGGTLDKLASLPGYQVTPSRRALLSALARRGLRHRRPERTHRTGRPAALCDPRCHRHGRVAAADHGQHPVEETRRRTAGPGDGREGRQRRVLCHGRRGARPGGVAGGGRTAAPACRPPRSSPT